VLQSRDGFSSSRMHIAKNPLGSSTISSEWDKLLMFTSLELRESLHILSIKNQDSTDFSWSSIKPEVMEDVHLGEYFGMNFNDQEFL